MVTVCAVGRARDRDVSRPQSGRPAFPQVMEIGFARFDPLRDLGLRASRRITAMSIGRPTPRLDRMVESMEIKLIFRAS